VVCIDTLGQDRELSDDDKRFVLNTVKNYREMWVANENENLLRDRNRKLRIMELDKEFMDSDAQRMFDEEERYVDEYINSRDDIFDDEMKELIMREIRLSFIGRLFKDRDDWKKNLFELKDFTVIKMPRVMQSLMYMLEYEREEICEKGTNKFFWKKAKNLINESFI